MKVLPINSYENKKTKVHNKKLTNYVLNPFVKKQEISFKSLAFVDFLKGMKNNFSPTEIVNKNIGRGILYKKLQNCDAKNLQNSDLAKFLESLPIITPQGIDALAKMLELRLKSLSWSYSLDLQMKPFYKKHEITANESKLVFDKELFNNFYKVIEKILANPDSKYYFYIDKFLDFLACASDKNGFHPEIVELANYSDFEIDYLKHFRTDSNTKNSEYNIEFVNYIQELLKLENGFSEENIKEIKENCFDKKGHLDKKALNFYKEQYEDKSIFMPRVCQFIRFLKDKDGIFQSQYKDYYEELNPSFQYNILPELLNYKLNFPESDLIKAMDKTVEILYYIKKNKVNNYPEIQDELVFLLENNNFEEFKKIHQTYGKNFTLKHIIKILNFASDNEEKIVPENLKIAEDIFTNMRKNDNELTSYTSEQICLIDLFGNLIDKNGKANLDEYSLIKRYHNKPYPAYILDVLLNHHGYSNFITQNFEKTIEYYERFVKDFAEEMEVAEGYDKDYFYAQKFKEYFSNIKLDDKKYEIVKKYMPIFTIKYCNEFLDSYGIRANNNIEQIAEIAELLKNNKQKLKDHDKDLNDDILLKFLVLNNNAISKLYSAIGKNVFVESFNLKFDEFKKFSLEYFNKNIDVYNTYLYEKINPKNSSKFKNLENKIKKEKNNLRLCLKPEHRKLIKENLSKILELEKNITPQNKKQSLQEIKTLKKEIQSIYKSRYLRPIIDKINKYSKEKNTILANAIKDPAKAFEILTSVLDLHKHLTKEELEEYIKIATKNNGDNQTELNNYVNKLVFKYNQIPYSEEISNKFNFVKNKYLPKLLRTHSIDFTDNFLNLCEIVKNDKTNDSKKMFDALPQNKETKKIFKKHHIDYDKLTEFNPESFVIVKTEANMNSAKIAAIRNLEVDMSEKLWQNIPQKETRLLYEELKKEGYERSDKIFRDDTLQFNNVEPQNGAPIVVQKIARLTKNGKEIVFEDLVKIISIIKKVFNQQDFWNTKNSDKNIEEARTNLITHLLEMRSAEIKNASHTEIIEKNIKVQKTDMNNIIHALFLGNHASCCTAIGSSNSWTAPLYIINKCVQSIEVLDGDEFVGNTMFFFAKVDGKLSLLLDNIELKINYQYNNNIRDAIFEYAKKLCAEVGIPNIPIYAGSLRHKVNMGKFDCSEHKVEILGKTDKEIYVDSMQTHKIGNKIFNMNLYKIK